MVEPALDRALAHPDVRGNDSVADGMSVQGNHLLVSREAVGATLRLLA